MKTQGFAFQKSGQNYISPILSKNTDFAVLTNESQMDVHHYAFLIYYIVNKLLNLKT